VSGETRAADWEARFRAGTTGWERGGLHPAFLAWRANGALAPCRILVPGAGRSPEPAALAAAGFDVTVVDVAPSAVAFQRERVGTAVEADLLAWSPAAPFEAIYDQTCLCALPPAVLPDYAARLHRWLVPGGRLFVLLMQTGRPGGPPFDCPPEAMRPLFPDALWGWPETPGAPVAHPSGFGELPCVLIRLA
jgi:SAM-dependent methyltransferase